MFYFAYGSNMNPYVKADDVPSIPVKEVRLKEGKRGVDGRNKPPQERATRTDAEGIALEMVMRLEETVNDNWGINK